MDLFSAYSYCSALFLMMCGFYVVLVQSNLFRKLVGLGVFQVSILIFYILSGYVKGGLFPILEKTLPLNPTFLDNPLLHVLMLTAIVVGVAVLAVGLVLVMRIEQEFGTIDESEL